MIMFKKQVCKINFREDNIDICVNMLLNRVLLTYEVGYMCDKIWYDMNLC